MKDNKAIYYNRCDSCDDYIESETAISMSFGSRNEAFKNHTGNFKLCSKCYGQIIRVISEREPKCIEG